MKLLQVFKYKAGLGLPDRQWYYRAGALIWLKEWISIEDSRLLKLEGSDLSLGWHAFIWYDKVKTHKYFSNHCIRKALLSVWDKVKHCIYEKIPICVSSVVGFAHPSIRVGVKVIRHADLLDEAGNLKLKQELQQQNFHRDW